jgi:hypothetical protein
MQGQTPLTSRRPGPGLQDILTGEEIARSGILNDPEVQQDLLQHLPTEQQNVDQLDPTVRSAQFQQSLGSLSHALSQTENFHQITSNFNLNPAAGQDQLVSKVLLVSVF